MQSIIDSFIKSYEKEYDYYETISRLAAQKVDTLLKRAGVRAIVTSRAKDSERLRAKLIKRESDNEAPYSSADDINSDIWDLAGVRIALYFPSDRGKVDGIIKSTFELLADVKEFPEINSKHTSQFYPKRFSGYWAYHYRVRFNPDSLSQDQARYSQARIEIQVASVLMHAWSEVEHDLVYKPLSGELSYEEYAILDELNGLVLAGEIALERLRAAGNTRIANNKEYSFNNQYEVASFLYSKYQAKAKSEHELDLGNINLLFKLMKRCGIESPSGLTSYLKSISVQNSSMTISSQIIDNIIRGNPGNYEKYRDLVLSQDAVSEEVSTAIGDFISQWIRLEQLLSTFAGENGARPINTNKLKQILSPRDMSLFMEIKAFRNMVVHGKKKPTLAELNEVTEQTAMLCSIIEDKMHSSH